MAFSTGLQLIVADAGSGVATALVSGGISGQGCQVYYSPWGKNAGPQAPWVLGASGSFNSLGICNLTITPASGFNYYQWLGVLLDGSGDAAQISTVCFRPLVNSAQISVWEQCVDSVVNWIISLNLPGLTVANINEPYGPKTIKTWWPRVWRDIRPVPPCCLVSPFGAEDFVNMMTNTDDVEYPVAVILVDAINRENTLNFTRDLLWREQISKAFRFQRLQGAPSVINSTLTNDVVVNPDAFSNNLLVSGMIFKFISREGRGVNGQLMP